MPEGHLVHRFSGGPVVHVHLGMRGLYLRYDDLSLPPRAGVRLRLAGAAAAWAGVGNAWRAELLFLARLAPAAPAASLDEAAARRLWQLARAHLALGRDAGQVVSDPTAPDERWVYKRDTCRSCGGPVRRWSLAGRTAYACPVEQQDG